MKIGIILHSQTGNTLSVGEKLLEQLTQMGHDVTLKRIKNLESPEKEQKAKDIKLDSMPEVDDYDALIFGAWVQAFQLCPGFSMYLNQLPRIDDKPVSCFVTQHFPFKWMGGSIALSKMKGILTSKGVKVKTTGVVNWTSKKKEQQIEELVNQLSGPFEGGTDSVVSNGK